MKVDYGVIHQAASDCSNTHKFLQDEFADLQGKIGKLMESWDGKAKEQYHVLQGDWNKNFREMSTLLNRIAIALPQIADGYQGTENDVTNLMSGM
ncbi:WXG100 family type VII secretion target [Amycolatopsis sp. CA-230715]|uniref:WXG100 family type VII secretion target n=1 Tax=Amycolatopsis sp. CA-230715 TaxID=2745196 RepID=UPI001C02FD0C|nr:WXG100 family type VII secretion target [Amycolatopsis sp. CA-230715]